MIARGVEEQRHAEHDERSWTAMSADDEQRIRRERVVENPRMLRIAT